jgi:hypothetical protein
MLYENMFKRHICCMKICLKDSIRAGFYSTYTYLGLDTATMFRSAQGSTETEAEAEPEVEGEAEGEEVEQRRR